MNKMYRHWFFPSGALMVVCSLVVLSWFVGGCCPVMYTTPVEGYAVYHEQPVVVYHAPVYYHAGHYYHHPVRAVHAVHGGRGHGPAAHHHSTVHGKKAKAGHKHRRR